MSTLSIPAITGLPPQGDSAAVRRRVVAVAIPHSDPLELIGPLEILRTANFLLASAERPDLGYDIEIVATVPGVICAWDGLTITADRSYADVRGAVDTILLQAMDIPEATLADEKFVKWIARMAPEVRRMTSICISTYLLAEAGLLDGRRATTHWAWCADFRKRYPEVKLEEEPIYVRDGNLFTSAGATSGLDLALALVEDDYGSDLALRAAQFLVLFLNRPGNQAQFSAQMSARLAEKNGIRAVQDYVPDNLNADLSVETLAERAAMSPRNFARVFARQVGMPPGQFVEQCRVERARHCLETSAWPVSRVAQTCGYSNPETMRTAFLRRLGVSPSAYRERFSGAG
jgi:transcriptional regulator GlxA family with amidase domain